ncbi:minor tail protein [Gordonia phage VanLee]|uniref:Minor tail protein n=1 Tax=Gordonia phage VanLee TaxID=2845816 RepID=A0A8F2D9D4_9CAUD|nr:minor tail protein [Gordonia phage VanLee]QWS68137.1 minor tail protein [Gordonia phage VanLee]
MNDYTVAVDIIDIYGREYRVSGPGMGLQNVELGLSPEGLLDGPVTTLWQETAFGWGAYYAGLRYNKRELVLLFNILGDDARHWYEVETGFRRGWSYTKDCTIRVTSESGVRELKVRLSEHTKTSMERDPRLRGFSGMVLTCVAGWPFWVGEDITREWELVSGTSGSGFFDPITNDTDMPMYAKYSLDVPGRWTLDDRSYGNDEFGRAEEDWDRTLPFPLLTVGQDATVDADPTEETLMCDDAAQRWGDLDGEDLLYPIPPGETVSIPISVTNASPGAAAQLRLSRNYQRMWGIVG